MYLLSQALWFMPMISAREAEKLEVSLGSIVSSKTAWTRVRPCLNNTSQQKSDISLLDRKSRSRFRVT